MSNHILEICEKVVLHQINPLRACREIAFIADFEGMSNDEDVTVISGIESQTDHIVLSPSASPSDVPSEFSFFLNEFRQRCQNIIEKNGKT